MDGWECERMASREAAERKARRREDAAGEETPRRRQGRRSIMVDGLGDPESANSLPLYRWAGMD